MASFASGRTEVPLQLPDFQKGADVIPSRLWATSVTALLLAMISGCASYQSAMDPSAVELVQSNSATVVYVDLPTPIRTAPKPSLVPIGTVALGMIGALAASAIDSATPDTPQEKLAPYNSVLGSITPTFNETVFQDVQTAVNDSPVLAHAKLIRIPPPDRPGTYSSVASHTGTQIALVVSPEVYVDRDGQDVMVNMHVQVWARDTATGMSEADFMDSSYTGYLPIPPFIGGHSDWRKAISKFSMDQCLSSWFATDASNFKTALGDGETIAISKLRVYLRDPN